MAEREDIMREGSATERDGSLSIQAGLLAIALVGVTLATFGPLFYPIVGYVLLAGSGLAALFGVRWADRVAHATAAAGLSGARRDSRIGAILSVFSLSFALYYTGFLFILVFAWPLLLFVGLSAWALHRSRVASAGASVVRT